MPYRIVFTKHSAKSIKSLSRSTQNRIRTALQRIKVRPFDFLEKMINHPYYKLRVGKYRIIMCVINEDLVILVVEVGHRKNIYRDY